MIVIEASESIKHGESRQDILINRLIPMVSLSEPRLLGAQ